MSKSIFDEIEKALETADVERVQFKVTIESEEDGKAEKETKHYWVACGEDLAWGELAAKFDPSTSNRDMLEAVAAILSGFIYESKTAEKPIYSYRKAELLASQLPSLALTIITNAADARTAKKKPLAQLKNFSAS